MLSGAMVNNERSASVVSLAVGGVFARPALYALQRSDLTGLFWTKLCEKLSLERNFSYAEEEVQRGADRGAAPSD